MKKLRAAKQALGSKEEKRKIIVGLDADIHRLLSEENYKRYRGVAVRARAMPPGSLGQLAPLFSLSLSPTLAFHSLLTRARGHPHPLRTR